jgi:hypothetical protein
VVIPAKAAGARAFGARQFGAHMRFGEHRRLFGRGFHAAAAATAAAAAAAPPPLSVNIRLFGSSSAQARRLLPDFALACDTE